MKIGIMQPYFFPYIGYFQLIKSVDVFVIYDNIKYTKKGWINRNRLLLNGRDMMFSLPLKNDSDSLNICERELAADFNSDKMLNQIRGVYRRAPYFEQTFPLVESIVRYKEKNLFRFLHNSIVSTCKHLVIGTELRVSSEIDIDHSLKNQDKVLALCQALGASTYVNAIGGTELYSKEAFLNKNIELKFIKTKPFEYAQFDNEFVSWLSIIDVMMFNPLENIDSEMLGCFDLI
jgi:hypothetical protein